ncbi:CHRD domain-containing protein [Streptomyces yaizuensis]|uniref:CHRD domain-containing protein n=1 Tax=Streptomyces yaizuensis TaxID=2989713 RepID=A0ABQ5P4S5_9ACTN|nr:CHRD domain-containing protein [Streptomyces sp. YSPA8]GLF97475.1 CHRD domain-containing protein [Streptomyces sp. YSPA8]
MKRTKAILIGTTAVAAAAGVGLAVLPAVAADGKGSAAGSGHAGHGAAEVVTARGADAKAKAWYFAAGLNGANEVPVPGGPAVGDRDGQALQFVRVQGDRVSVAVKFRGTDKPTALHIHQGKRGTNGGVKIDFTPLLSRITYLDGWKGAVTGTVKVKDKAVLEEFVKNPNGFYANLHTARFPGGAVRAQFHRVTQGFPFAKALDNFQASVVKGRQVYECKKAPAGGWSFQQRDVTATLGGKIAHSFVAPNSGTPQWIAPDRSAVTGTLISKVDNGARNIPELVLKATRSGRASGLLARNHEILRLNTVGGVAPRGSCAKGAIAKVAYGADYVFILK